MQEKRVSWLREQVLAQREQKLEPESWLEQKLALRVPSWGLGQAQKPA